MSTIVKMRYKIQILFVVISVYSFSQDYTFEDINKLAFEQKYRELLVVNCDTTMPMTAYCKSLKDDISSNIPKKAPFNPIDELFFNEISKDIVIINEHHLFPQNRVFNHSIIRHLLADTNYYFFFEALTRDIYWKDKDTTNLGSYYGYYIQEPQMAENIRLVLQNKKNTYSYDASDKAVDWNTYYALGLEKKVSKQYIEKFEKLINSPSYYTKSLNIRDMNQFINFYIKYHNIKKKSPKAKFVILCGHGHVAETGNRDWVTLAYHIKKHISDPITIDITNLIDVCPHFKYSYERNKYYDVLLSSLPNDKIFYYASYDSLRKTEYYKKLALIDPTNYKIWSPPVSYENNRETWLQYDGKRKVLVEKGYYARIKNNSLVLKAYYKNENPKKSTPADVLYIDKKSSNYFMLYKGEYDIYCGNKLLYTATVE
ncbi:MAG: hypothetical protein JXR60_02355 [Bacteroidales bacterium]|nr:hypothetical protein [Bacteroidales bacterium]